MLLDEYAGQENTTREVYEKHSVGKPYLMRNYKDILLKLELEGKLVADPPAHKRRKRKGKITFGDNVLIKFPKKI
jgi:hypothetical protein